MLDGRYLGALDSDFVESIVCDIKAYISDSTTGVLIFPPVDNYHRLLIHKTVEEDFPGFRTFSIGEGDDRRTVVCPETIAASEQELMDHNVGMGRKGFGGRGQQRGRSSTDCWQDQAADHWGGIGGSAPRSGHWTNNRPNTLPRQRGKWEHDDRTGPTDAKGQTYDAPRRRGRGRGRASTVSPQFPKKNLNQDQAQLRRGSSDWTGTKDGQRVRQNSEASWSQASTNRGTQPSPHMGRRGSDMGGNVRRRQNELGPGDPTDDRRVDRNGPEGAEPEGPNKQKSRNRRPDAQVYVPRPRRLQTEEFHEAEPTRAIADLPPQGSTGRPGSARRNQRNAMDVYVPRVKRAEQEHGVDPSRVGEQDRGHSRPQDQQQHLQATWQQDVYYPAESQEQRWDFPTGYMQQKRRKSADNAFSPSTERRRRDGHFEARNRYQNQNVDPTFTESNKGWEGVAEQTFYNRSLVGNNNETWNDNQLNQQTGHNRWMKDDRTDRPPSRTRRRRRSHSNSSRKSQPSPNRTNFGNQRQNQRESGRRGSDTWGQDDHQQNRFRGRRPSDAWSQDESHDGHNSLHRMRRSSSSHQFDESQSGHGGHHSSESWSPSHHPTMAWSPSHHPNDQCSPSHRPNEAWSPSHHQNEPWSPSHHQNEPWSPTHHPNEQWGQTHHQNEQWGLTHYPNEQRGPTRTPSSPSWNRNDSRARGRTRRSSGSRNKEESWNPNQCQNEPWMQNKPQQQQQQQKGRPRRLSGNRNPEESWNPNYPNESRRVRQSSESWSQDEYSSLDRARPNNQQRGKRWQQNDSKSPRQTRHGSRNHSRNASESSDVDNWDSDNRAFPSNDPKRGAPTGRIIIEVTPGGRNVSDTTQANVSPYKPYDVTHDESVLEESVRAQASDVTDKVRSMLADLSEINRTKDSSTIGTDLPDSQYSEGQQTFGSDSILQEYKVTSEDNCPCDSASSNTSPSHHVITYTIQPAAVPHVDTDDFSSDGQSSVQPESSTSAESPDAADSANVSSAGERESSPGCWSPSPHETVPQTVPQPTPTDVVNGVAEQYNSVIESSETVVADVMKPEEPVEVVATLVEDNQKHVNSDEEEETAMETEPSVHPGTEPEEVIKVEESEVQDVPSNDQIARPTDHLEVLPGQEETTQVETDCVSEQSVGQTVEDTMSQVTPSVATEVTTSDEGTDVAGTTHQESKEQEEHGETAKEEPAETGGQRELSLDELLDSALPLPKMNWADMMEEEGGESWDRMFDDTGEALDPKLLEELTLSVGKPVRVKKPQSQYDYYNYQPRDPEMDNPAFGNLIEIYDFAPDLVTRDLHMAFKDFHDRGFDIKWVDDTHAIGIFASSIAAEGALQARYALLKVRPITQASRQTKVKAKNCAEFLEPHRTRPETTAAVARNMVTGALGIKSRIPREKRDAERIKLKEARDKKRSAQRQKKDAWEGTFGKCAMDG